ncbi:Succinate dehydrogenase/fumarate reductase, cytochrome b subunit [Acidipropionibacterium jensenii]|uniref:Succinate dehydrogenase/fumarate reductase, cytochrome b subunit n=2 Tax=Acidipropionibacterium jensenii TaxID=1749 RepID=A0A3S4W736_9ACTN|nr:Succinate dehydrogenase/fumarate reductase, cytochrome b subunit [Acidipropionibacterium jensenii]
MSVTDRTASRTDEPAAQGDAVVTVRHARLRPSNVTLKVVMAVTGTIFALFVLVHMIGNLKALMGPEEFNSYARFLRVLAHPLIPYEGVLWILRIVLLGCLVSHVWAGVLIWWRGRRSRGGHRRRGMAGLTWGARTMLLSGILLLGFVVVHLLDLTLGAGLESSSFRAPVRTGPADVDVHAYQNLVASLSRPPMAIYYSLMMLVIGVHLAQGIWNVINDLGGTGPRLRRIWLLVGLLVALAVVIGNGTLPILILTGVIS